MSLSEINIKDINFFFFFSRANTPAPKKSACVCVCVCVCMCVCACVCVWERERRMRFELTFKQEQATSVTCRTTKPEKDIWSVRSTLYAIPEKREKEMGDGWEVIFIISRSRCSHLNVLLSLQNLARLQNC